MFIHLALLFTFSWLESAFCLRNNTVNDQDPLIVYNPRASWEIPANSPLDYESAHMLTSDPSATATFTFTGVAVFFMSPLWPYPVDTMVSLDSGARVLINLTDPSPLNTGPSETVQSQVVWGVSGLTNTVHKLVISVGQKYAVVDGLVFTTLDPSDLTTSITSTSSSTSTLLTSTSTPTSTPTPSASFKGSSSSFTSTSTTSADTTVSSGVSKSSSSKHVVAIAVGSALGAGALIIIVAVIFFCCRRSRKRRPISEAWTVDGSPYTGPAMSTTPGNVVNGGNDYAYHQPYDNGWTSASHSSTAMSPFPGAMAPATAAALAHPYASATPATESDQGDSWQGTTTQIAQRFMRSPHRYQPNTLSTITESSTPLAHSPSSHLSEVAMDPRLQGQDSQRSLSSGGAPVPNMVPILSDSKMPYLGQPPAYTVD